MKIVDKPWGREIWIAYDNGRYAGKILEIENGHRLSLQYHRVKHETLYVLEGRVRFTLEDSRGMLDEEIMTQGGIKVVEPGKKHRMEALRFSRLIEFSSPELDDVVRLEDDYSRSAEKDMEEDFTS